MLGHGDGPVLHLGNQGAAGTQLPAGLQANVELAAAEVLQVLLEVELHDRIGPGGAEAIPGGHDQDRVRGLLAFGLFLGNGGHRRFRGQSSPQGTDQGRREAIAPHHVQEMAALGTFRFAVL